MNVGTAPALAEENFGMALLVSISLLPQIPASIFYRWILLPLPSLEIVPCTEIWENCYLQLLDFPIEQSKSAWGRKVLPRCQSTVLAMFSGRSAVGPELESSNFHNQVPEWGYWWGKIHWSIAMDSVLIWQHCANSTSFLPWAYQGPKITWGCPYMEREREMTVSFQNTSIETLLQYTDNHFSIL